MKWSQMKAYVTQKCNVLFWPAKKYDLPIESFPPAINFINGA